MGKMGRKGSIVKEEIPDVMEEKALIERDINEEKHCEAVCYILIVISVLIALLSVLWIVKL